jgi:hypothetical protein
MTYDKERLDQENRDVLARNIKGSQEVIRAKEAKQTAGNSNPPLQDEPGSMPDTPPTADVPAGGTSGGEQNLSGGYRSEPSS